jgi:hypothetical protein
LPSTTPDTTPVGIGTRARTAACGSTTSASFRGS